MPVPSPHATPPTATARTRRRGAVAVLAALALLAAACSGSSSSAARPEATSTTGADTAGATGTAPVATDAVTRPPTAAEAALVAARPYDLRVPPDVKDPAPLVILLHGYGASGMLQEIYFKLGAATDAQGMLLVTVDGTPNARNQRFWNATDACCAGPITKVDDVAYLRAVVADVAAKHPVDPKRVYFVGHSNGGFMSYRMACDHAGLVAAIVSLEAATWADPARCRPSEPVAVLEIHGTGDRTIAYDGASISGKTYPGAKQTVATWARYDGCRLEPDDPPPAAHRIETGRAPATVTAYSKGCRGNGHVELWTEPHGVHIPPLDPTFSPQIVAYLLAHPKR